MSYSPTRRDFLGDAAKAGVASALKLDLSPLPKSAMPAQPERNQISTAQWRFFKGDTEGAQAPDFNDGNWRTLDLPHDWSIEGPFSEDAPAAGNGAYLPTGIGWYRKQFTLPGRNARETCRVAVRRSVPAKRSLDQRNVAGNAAVWVHYLFL